MLVLLASLACAPQTKVPDGTLWWSVEVTGAANSCHPDNTEGYRETFDYGLFLDGSAATVYIGEQMFATGSITGCNLTYQTMEVGEDLEGGHLSWQLFGQAKVDSVSDGTCVEGDGDWAGTEYFEIIQSEDDSVEPGCTYEMTTTGTVASGA